MTMATMAKALAKKPNTWLRVFDEHGWWMAAVVVALIVAASLLG